MAPKRPIYLFGFLSKSNVQFFSMHLLFLEFIVFYPCNGFKEASDGPKGVKLKQRKPFKSGGEAVSLLFDTIFYVFYGLLSFSSISNMKAQPSLSRNETDPQIENEGGKNAQGQSNSVDDGNNFPNICLNSILAPDYY